jgi:hypothetical protein
VLAALVPERVLPFASGGSRKRWLRPSRGEPRKPRWGAERRARPLQGVQGVHWAPVFSAQAGRTEPRRAPHRKVRHPVVRLSAPRLPSFRGGFGNGLVRQNSDADASRERMSLRVLSCRHPEVRARSAGLEGWRLHRRAAVALRGSAFGRAPQGDGPEVCVGAHPKMTEQSRMRRLCTSANEAFPGG